MPVKQILRRLACAQQAQHIAASSCVCRSWARSSNGGASPAGRGAPAGAAASARGPSSLPGPAAAGARPAGSLIGRGGGVLGRQLRPSGQTPMAEGAPSIHSGWCGGPHRQSLNGSPDNPGCRLPAASPCFRIVNAPLELCRGAPRHPAQRLATMAAPGAVFRAPGLLSWRLSVGKAARFATNRRTRTRAKTRALGAEKSL